MSDEPSRPDEAPMPARYNGDTEAIRRNPFLAALPPARSEKDWEKKLSRVHDELASQEMTDRARDLRIGATEETTVALPQAIRFAKDVVALLHDGYHCRRLTGNVARMNAPDVRQKHLEAVVDKRVPRRRLGQKALALIGISGSGKTTTLRAILESFPPVIEHTLDRPGSPKVLQIVWLLLDAPAGRSMKGLCLAILDAFDEVLYTSLAEQLTRKSADVLQRKIRDLTRDYSVGVIAIDESQVLKGKGVNQNDLIDYLVTLTNIVGVPLIFVGTPDTQSVLRAAPRIVRRTLHAKHLWNPLPMEEAWVKLVNGMLANERVGMPFEPSTEGAAKAFHPLVEGVPAYLAKMLVGAERAALRDKRKSFTLADCRKVADEFPDEVREILDVIRKQRGGVRFSATTAEPKARRGKGAHKGPVVQQQKIPGFGDIRRVR
jgi:hypothetical protein